MNQNGNAIAVWERYDISPVRVQASMWNGSVWSTPDVLSSSDQGDANLPQISMNTSGSAVTIWEKIDELNDNRIQASRWNGSSWSALPDTLSDGGQNAYTPQISIDANGNAIAVWRRFDGSNYRIQAAFFTNIAPPKTFFGEKITNRFPLQSECFNRLEWTSSISDGIANFKLFRNGVLIVTLSSDKFIYDDHLRPCNGSDTYSIISIDNQGNESSPLIITIR